MDIENTVREFLSIVLNDKYVAEDLELLIVTLDKLAYLVNNLSYEFDEKDYPDSPEQNYQVIRQKIQSNFPSLGYYNATQDISENLENTTIVVGDAIDDLADIVSDLKNVLWCFENTSKNDALWHYQNSFRSHWGKHLRGLQLYLHDKWW